MLQDGDGQFGGQLGAFQGGALTLGVGSFASAAVDQADLLVAVWAEQFLALCRRLSPAPQQTYKRDLDKYVLPRSAPTGSVGCLPIRSRTG